MNKQKKDGNISWTDYTWNPIKGLCPVGCKYCYARAMYKRFKLYEGHKFPYVPISEVMERHPQLKLLKMLKLPKKPSKIFVCSTYELFHKSIDASTRDVIFNVINNNPQHTFQILTKMPENIDRPMPDNVWLGVSVTSYADYHMRIHSLADAEAKTKFMSIEPLLDYGKVLDGAGRIKFYSTIGVPFWLAWIIVGRLTGHGRVSDPPRWHIRRLVNDCDNLQIPIFLKNNLKEIWDEKLIQEFPDANL